MEKFTVVLLRSYKFDDLPDSEEFGKDVYVALVEEENIEKAILAAKKEALAADTKDHGKDLIRGLQIGIADYIFSVMFKGHIEPLWFGWQEK